MAEEKKSSALFWTVIGITLGTVGGFLATEEIKKRRKPKSEESE